MQATIITIRAIGAEYAKRTLLPLIIVGSIFVIALLVLGGWLTTQSAWWWILQGSFIFGVLVFMALAVVVHVMLRALAPTLSKVQKKSVRDFVDKLQRVSENIGTPKIIVAYRVMSDTIRPTGDGFIQTISRDSKTLASDFAKLREQLKLHATGLRK